jgi:hypothetical protein
MTGLPSLKDLADRELARRSEAESVLPPIRFVESDAADATMNVEAAVKAIEAFAEARNIGQRVTPALAAAHPRQFSRPGNHVNIISRIIVHPDRAAMGVAG